jgi:cytochrome c biogenesis protein CcmG, thiol:disulfide interchange protein DsbE
VRATALAALAVLAATGCSGSSTRTIAPDFPKPPSYDQLVARAALDPCPASSSAHPRKSLPNLTLPCLGRGPAVHLSGLSGAPTVINIWGSWCGPCQAETGYLSTVYDAAHGKVRFLGVDTEDDPKSALDFAPHVTPPMRYPQVVDKDKRVLIGLNIPSNVPSSVFVDASGRVVHVFPGAYHSADALRADINRYLRVTV